MPTQLTSLRHTVNAVPRTLNRHQPKHLFTHPIKEKPRSLERGVSVSNHLPHVVQPKPGPHRRQTYQYVQKHIARRQEKLPVVVQRKGIQRKRGKRGKPAQQPHDYKQPRRVGRIFKIRGQIADGQTAQHIYGQRGPMPAPGKRGRPHTYAVAKRRTNKTA